MEQGDDLKTSAKCDAYSFASIENECKVLRPTSDVLRETTKWFASSACTADIANNIGNWESNIKACIAMYMKVYDLTEDYNDTEMNEPLCEYTAAGPVMMGTHDMCNGAPRDVPPATTTTRHQPPL